VNSNSHDVTGLNAFDVQLLQSFVNDHGITKAGGRRSGEHIEPAWCDDADAERPVTRIDEKNLQCASSQAALWP
jgi:hypothetical protein